MKKLLIFTLFILAPTFILAQTNHNSQQVGLKLAYSGESGLITELSYAHPIAKNYYTSIRLRNNGLSFLGLSAGLGRSFQLHDRWTLRIGAEYGFGRYFPTDYSNWKHNIHQIRLPVELQFHINDHVFIGTEIGPSLYLNQANDQRKFAFIPSLRFGYRF